MCTRIMHDLSVPLRYASCVPLINSPPLVGIALSYIFIFFTLSTKRSRSTHPFGSRSRFMKVTSLWQQVGVGEFAPLTYDRLALADQEPPEPR